MTNKQLAHTLIDLNMTHEELARALGTTRNTITRYKRDNRFPKMFVLAVEALKLKMKDGE